MEDRIESIQSPQFEAGKFKEQLERMEQISAEAKQKIDFASAHDPNILKSIEVVENFLRKSHRLCYGGQAINAHLPKKYKFYDPEYTIPDYDFFTPNQEEDIQELGKMLRLAGFTEISDREGMHKGTKKLYVNYIPVADLTSLDTSLYTLLSKQEFKADGISYMDSNTLRMLMYLELSRPKGEVERWSKVYERLLLLNEFAPVKSCKSRFAKHLLSTKEIDSIMDFVVKERRVFAGADIVGYYKHSFGKTANAKWLLATRQPIYFYTPDLEGDTKHFTYELQHSSSRRTYVSRVESKGGDLIPKMTIFLRNKTPFLVLFAESACHSYYNVPIKYEKYMRVATIDTLVTLFFSLSLLQYKYMSLAATECLAKELVEISYRARNHPDTFPFPFISLLCSGHQKGLPSLIRDKVARVKQQRLIPVKTRKLKSKGSADVSSIRI